MTKSIESYYRSRYQEAFWLVGIAILNFILGILAISYWGNVGAGLLIILGGFAIYQATKGFWSLLFEQNLIKIKTQQFDTQPRAFVDREITFLENQQQAHDKYKTYLMISFLLGLLFLFLGVFGNWSELSLGIGAGLAFQCAIMLIFGLLADYRAAFYLQRLRKFLV